MFKADGTEIRNPAAYAAGIAQRGYHEQLFNADGYPIEDPIAFVSGMDMTSKKRAYSESTPSTVKRQKTEDLFFKEDGTPIRDPVAYVAGIERRGYKEKLFDKDRNEIKNPVAYVAAMQRRGQLEQGGLTHVQVGAMQHRAPSHQAGGMYAVVVPSQIHTLPARVPFTKKGAQGGVMFKADGTPVRNPEAFVAGIEKHGYTETIYGPDGSPIKNPVAYVAAMLARGDGSVTSQKDRLPLVPKCKFEAKHRPSTQAASGGIFKADGTPIRNPAAFVAGIMKNGYTDILYDAEHMPISDPVAYLKL